MHGEVVQSLLALARMNQRADEIRSGAVGAVSIVTNGALAINFLPKVIAAFQVENPGLSVELKVHSSRQIASLVSGGQVDIGWELIGIPSQHHVPCIGVNTSQSTRCGCYFQFMLHGVAGEGSMIGFEVEFEMISQIILPQEVQTRSGI